MERLDHFMARANAAYYADKNPFADFTTSPELCQAFGEVLGAWCAVVWQAMGQPEEFLLAEAGPGRGTLMADARRVLARVAPDCHAAARLHLIETSPRLRAIQAERLGDAVWHERIESLPDGPLILLANEFLDALPIRQFVRRGTGWVERYVAAGAFVERPSGSPGWNAAEGGVVEINEVAQAIVAQLAARLALQGGVALLIDYGTAVSTPGDSLQALFNGEPADPLAHVGAADITAHVDFAALALVARDQGAAVFGPVTQGKFLTALGLMPRAQALARTQAPRQASDIMATAQRITEPDRMGTLFKVLAVCHPDQPLPPGFAA